MGWSNHKWWDRNKTKFKDDELHCPDCSTRPTLIQSGNADPKSMKCPVCKEIFDSQGIKFDTALAAEEAEKAKKQKETDELTLWEEVWSQGSVFIKKNDNDERRYDVE